MGYFGSGQDISFDGPVFSKHGIDPEGVEEMLEQVDTMDVDQVRGHVIFYATLVMGDSSVARVSRSAFARFMEKNMLMREFAPGLQKLEQEVKQMAKEMIGLPGDTRVNITGGGSESLYCSINTALQWAKQHKPDMTAPEIVVPYTMHAAVSKWCRYTGIHIKRVPVGTDLRADVGKMEEAITKNTFYIAGSAPCWPYGLFDPIEKIAHLAQKHMLWMHVDACLGGYQAPFIEKVTGKAFPAWRIGQVPGVMSMSADLHKHGYAAKPISTVFYLNKALQEFHWCHPGDWPDGKYSSESMMGSFPAGSVASAWAVMKHLGEQGYLKPAQRTLAARKKYESGINAIPGLKTMPSDLGVLLFEAGELDALAVLSGLIQEKCYALPCYQPMRIKIAVDPVSDEVINNFLTTLGRVVEGVSRGTITSSYLMKYL